MERQARITDKYSTCEFLIINPSFKIVDDLRNMIQALFRLHVRAFI